MSPEEGLNKEIARLIILQMKSDATEQFNVWWAPMVESGQFENVDAGLLAIVRRAFVVGWQAALLRLLEEEKEKRERDNDRED